MKRLCIAAALLVCVAAICLFETKYLDNTLSETYAFLADIDFAVNSQNTEKAVKLCRELEENWREKSDILCHFVSSDNLTSAQLEMFTLKTEILHNNGNYYIVKNKTELLLENLREGEKFAVF